MEEIDIIVYIYQKICLIGMNVKQVNGEWYDTVSDEEIGNVCIFRQMIEVR